MEYIRNIEHYEVRWRINLEHLYAKSSSRPVQAQLVWLWDTLLRIPHNYEDFHKLDKAKIFEVGLWMNSVVSPLRELLGLGRHSWWRAVLLRRKETYAAIPDNFDVRICLRKCAMQRFVF